MHHATLKQSGFHWLLRFSFADSDRVLAFPSEHDAMIWATHWKLEVERL